MRDQEDPGATKHLRCSLFRAKMIVQLSICSLSNVHNQRCVFIKHKNWTSSSVLSWLHWRSAHKEELRFMEGIFHWIWRLYLELSWQVLIFRRMKIDWVGFINLFLHYLNLFKICLHLRGRLGCDIWQIYSTFRIFEAHASLSFYKFEAGRPFILNYVQKSFKSLLLQFIWERKSIKRSKTWANGFHYLSVLVWFWPYVFFIVV